MKGKKDVTGMPAPEHRNSNEQLRLTVFDNRDLETAERNRMMLNHPAFSKNSNTQINAATELMQTPWGTFSRQPPYMEEQDAGSSTSETSESALQKNQESEYLKLLSLPPTEDLTGYEHHHEFTVRVYTYGNPHETFDKLLIEMSKGLNRAFGDNFEIDTPHGIAVHSTESKTHVKFLDPSDMDED